MTQAKRKVPYSYGDLWDQRRILREAVQKAFNLLTATNQPPDSDSDQARKVLREALANTER